MTPLPTRTIELTPSPSGSVPPSATPTSTADPAAAAASASASTASSEAATPAADTRKGAALDEPFTVKGIVVVSPKHPISKNYVPKTVKPNGLTAETQAAMDKMVKAAKADGVTIKVRSGYRSYAEQAKILARKIIEYGDEAKARRYNAEAGKSEHQTGLAADLWDGVTWGDAVKDTKVGRWLWKHAREYGFILRYPPGSDKEKITGYIYEPWHYRYIGVADSMNFPPNTDLTLEEYLGIE